MNQRAIKDISGLTFPFSQFILNSDFAKRLDLKKHVQSAYPHKSNMRIISYYFAVSHQ